MNDNLNLQQGEYCHYHFLPESKIHHIIYQAVGRKAVDEFLVLFQPMLKDTPTDDVIRMIVDNNVDDEPQPLNYLIGRIRTYLSMYPKRAAVRIAIVYHKRNPLVSIIDMIFRSMRRGNDQLRYFQHENWDDMMDWLKADD